ncbi:MAG: type II toxin-antitoxin system RelE/ParE family toxin [Endomicrobium sp.]|jgi:putative addiction module killer protein|nr:type II toxin-antitoxin system RelE/ParE family toxin [Endomicrobium sp.]
MGQLKRDQTKIFQKWFSKLSSNIQDKIAEYIDRVLDGNILNCKTLRKGISEIVINYQRGYRVYYTILQNKTILLLLSGGNKGGNQREQQRDIEKAAIIRDYLKEKEEI